MNMILGGNILRFGGNTKYVMYIDKIGSWCVGVPLAFLTARVLNLPIEGINFIVTYRRTFPSYCIASHLYLEKMDVPVEEII